MFLTIQLKSKESSFFLNLPDSFVMMVDDSMTLKELLDILGFRLFKDLLVKVNGLEVKDEMRLAENDVVEIWFNRLPREME